MSKREPATSGGDPRETGVGSVFVSNYPPYSAWGARDVARVREVLQEPPRPDAPLGLYLHVPFCSRVCPYCDFAVTIVGEQRRAAWVDGIVREAAMYSDIGLGFDTLYLGGGTPSSLDASGSNGSSTGSAAISRWIRVRRSFSR